MERVSTRRKNERREYLGHGGNSERRSTIVAEEKKPPWLSHLLLRLRFFPLSDSIVGSEIRVLIVRAENGCQGKTAASGFYLVCALELMDPSSNRSRRNSFR